MNNREDAESNPAGGPPEPTAGPAEGSDLTKPTAPADPPPPDAPVPGIPENQANDPSPATDQFAPVPPGSVPQAYTQERHDTAQLDVPPDEVHRDGFAPYSGPPSDGPPPGGGGPDGGGVSPQRPKRRKGLIAGVVALSIVLLLVISGVGSELYLRSKAKDCMEQSFGELTGASTSVSLSKQPMLFQWVSGKIPYVQVDTSDEGDSDMKLHARGDDITTGDNTTTIGGLKGEGYVPFGRIMELSQQDTTAQPTTPTPDQGGGLTGLLGSMGGGMTVESVTGNAAAGTVTLKASFSLLGIPIPAETELKPVTQNGKLTFEVVKASALTLGIPNSWAQTLVDQVSAGMFPPLFDDVSFDRLSVSDKGVEFAFSGNDIALTQENVGASDSNAETCSVV
ncbi:MAG: DUF2993 domain-containing protein [Gordonia sp.]|nr:DUF2993 domain-containing protein [Gordonia sp. (in: high G+C Gram-positive bacteria)]